MSSRGPTTAKAFPAFLRRAVAAGWSDVEISEVLDRTCGSILNARQELGLASATPGGSPTPGAVHRMRQARFEARFERPGDLDALPTPHDGPAEAAIRKEERLLVPVIMASLDSRQRRVLDGLAAGETLKKTGIALGVTREYVRQLRIKIFKCLRLEN